MARARLGRCDIRHVIFVRPMLRVLQSSEMSTVCFIFDQLCVKMLNVESIYDFFRNFNRHVLCTPLIYLSTLCNLHLKS